MKNFYPFTLRQTISLMIGGTLLGLIFCAVGPSARFIAHAQQPVRANIRIGDKGEAPTMAVRCYASNIDASQLQTELAYLQDFAWQDISVRYQPGTQSLVKVTARAFYTFERGPAEFDRILEQRPTAFVVTCG